jgi:hypothetical protein
MPGENQKYFQGKHQNILHELCDEFLCSANVSPEYEEGEI